MPDQLEQKNNSVEQLTRLQKTVGLESLKKIESIDKEIQRIQNSTKTTFPSFIGIHNYLRMRFPAYYNWHISAFANFINLTFLLIYLLLFALFINEKLTY